MAEPQVRLFSDRPLEHWLRQFQTPGPLEDRYRAFVAITTLADTPAAWDIVAAALHDSENDIRAAAANWLAVGLRRQRLAESQTELVGLIPALTALLNDPDPDVGLAAAHALGFLSPDSDDLSAAIIHLFGRDDIQPTSQSLLAELCGRVPTAGGACVHQLKTLLQAEQADVREAAALAFTRLGSLTSQAIPELTTALDDEEPLVRESAAIALRSAGHLPPETISALTQASQDEDTDVAKAATETLRTLAEMA